MKQFFEVNGSFRGFHDTIESFATLTEARVCAEKMKQDGLRSVVIYCVVETAEWRHAETA